MEDLFDNVCKYCGNEFEGEDEDDDICEDCNEIIDNSQDPELLMALVEEFECDLSDIVEIDSTTYTICGDEYYVYTESEADDAVRDNIEESLWAFNPSFLSGLTGIDEIVFEAIQSNDRCESNNDAIQSILDATNVSLEDVADEAVRWDGRGHYLSSYDGEETEISTENGYYYCYRQ